MVEKNREKYKMVNNTKSLERGGISMRIGTARCPKCEAKIDVDINSNTTVCEKCGETINVKEAINKQFEEKYLLYKEAEKEKYSKWYGNDNYYYSYFTKKSTNW